MISAVVNTYNEEQNIERCLSSLADLAGEIVMVDMGSNDRTCQKAKSFSVRLFKHAYTGFVEPARNFAISKAKGDWVLILDADEEIPKTLADYIKDIVLGKKVDFCRIPRKNIIFDKWITHAGWWPDYQIRFFKKGMVTWTDKIHGIPLTRGNGLDFPAEESLSIVHHNYQTIEQFIERLNRYSGIAAKEMYLADKRFKPECLFDLPVREFVQRYFVQEGYKDGVHGLGLSLLQSFSEISVYLKLWELENFKEEKISVEDVRSMIENEYRHKRYWLYDLFLSKPHSILESLIWRIKRKL
ncbi:glycosyltransferase family 2 protein [Patescibacteria group bacterium]|nr:glycosyltransferase family 2 protein [Patescibacteria group bacterium]MCL5798002.1 glycosyltransferase family 2 protein [Patescibacteria group bacterium]